MSHCRVLRSYKPAGVIKLTYATPVYGHVPCTIELITLIEITPGGAFDKAGFNSGDVFDNSLFPSANVLFEKLDKPGGTRIEFEVLPGDLFIPDCNFDAHGKTVKRIVVAP